MNNSFIEITISIELREECLELFGKIRILDTPESFRAFVIINTKLAIIDKYCIPKSKELNHSELLASLLETRSPTREPILFTLLDALAYEYRELDIGRKCSSLKEEIIKESFLSTEGPQAISKRVILQDTSSTNINAKSWFAKAGNDDEIAFRIALAAFNRTTESVIRDAHANLVTLLQTSAHVPAASNHETASKSHTPPLDEELGAVDADKSPDNTIQLRSQSLATEALIYVGHNYERWRDVLMEWLKNFVIGRPVDVRTRAAIAAGVIASANFSSFCSEFSRWVKEQNPEKEQKIKADIRAALGIAFQVAIRDKRCAEQIQRQLRKWSQSDERDERWAAARIYMYVGTYCASVSDVMMQWRNIATREESTKDIQIWDFISGVLYFRLINPLHMSLMDAMMRFFDSITKLTIDEQRRLFAEILAGIKQWIRADEANDKANKKSRTEIKFGLPVFLSLAEMSSSKDGQSEPLLFGLIDTASSSSSYRKELAEILCRTLLLATSVLQTKELLQGWLNWVESNKDNTDSYPDSYKEGISKMVALLTEMIAVDQKGSVRGVLLAYLNKGWKKIGAADDVLKLLEG